jgi:hypothetical protein
MQKFNCVLKGDYFVCIICRFKIAAFYPMSDLHDKTHPENAPTGIMAPIQCMHNMATGHSDFTIFHENIMHD